MKPKVSRLPARYVPLLSAGTTRSRRFYFIVRIKGLSASAPLPLIKPVRLYFRAKSGSEERSRDRPPEGRRITGARNILRAGDTSDASPHNPVCALPLHKGRLWDVFYHRKTVLTICYNCVYCAVEPIFISTTSPSTTRRSRTLSCPGRWPPERRCPASGRWPRTCVSASSPRSGPMTSWSGRGSSTPCRARAALAERSAELLREERLRKIEGYMQEIRRLAAACGLTEDELAEMWRVQKEETE